MTFARELWLRIETIHAVTYFGEETQHARTEAGLDGFWISYFGLRAAPLGAVSAGAVEATFFNFAPSFVARWVPEVWDLAEPSVLIEARSAAAAATLRRVSPGIDAAAEASALHLQGAIDRAEGAGRALFAANRDIALPDDPVAALWQQCTTLREHRGDGHVAALTAAGIGGLEAHVLIALEQGSDPTDLQKTRGWTADDWADAVERCHEWGMVDESGGLSDAGRDLRAAVEESTDDLAVAPWRQLGAGDRADLIDSLDGAARAVAASGVLRYPNPIGLPRLG